MDTSIVSTLMKNIIREAATHYGVSVKSVQSRIRSKAVSAARQLAIYLARTLTSYSLTELGQYFDYRNHATINYSYRKVLVKMRLESGFAQQVVKISARLLSEESTSDTPESCVE